VIGIFDVSNFNCGHASANETFIQDRTQRLINYVWRAFCWIFGFWSLYNELLTQRIEINNLEYVIYPSEYHQHTDTHSKFHQTTRILIASIDKPVVYMVANLSIFIHLTQKSFKSEQSISTYKECSESNFITSKSSFFSLFVIDGNKCESKVWPFLCASSVTNHHNYWSEWRECRNICTRLFLSQGMHSILFNYVKNFLVLLYLPVLLDLYALSEYMVTVPQ
jgi:hypothetical protein